MRVIFNLFFALILLAILIALFIFSGTYNVAATGSESAFVNWLLATARNQSIAAHSTGIQPPSLTDAALVQAGFREYHEMCFGCHGAPGQELNEVAKGMNPSPPKLEAQEVQARNDAELFWITKNGIRMTGMPAFGPSHKDQTLWSIVAFLRRMRSMTGQEYKSMVEAAGLQAGEEHEHDHEHGQAAKPEQGGRTAAGEGAHTHEHPHEHQH